jgi:hypothetical protein
MVDSLFRYEAFLEGKLDPSTRGGVCILAIHKSPFILT